MHKKSKPIKSMQELRESSLYRKRNHHHVNIPLASRSHPPDNNSKVIVCHDFSGGYGEDANNFGTFYGNGDRPYPLYTFQHWQWVDTFIYFSHERVAIPPVQWVNAAHKNGVKILGTFITEWKPGISENGMLLEKQDGQRYPFADKLVDIAVYYGFDGWFFNFESPFPPQFTPTISQELCNFLKYTTRICHQAIPGSQVIMYDSITIDNEVKWQDCLSEKNQVFFDTCDGLFTNYTWTMEKLEKSSQNGVRCGRVDHVYTGNDIWGRNTFGGGEFNTHKALRVIKDHQTSVALFAPAWTFEKLGHADFLSNDHRLWYDIDEGISWHLNQRVLTGRLFYTCFDRGFGKKYFDNGRVVRDGYWHNMSCQSITPNMQHSKRFISKESNETTRVFEWELIDDIAWSGGTAVEISSCLSSSTTGTWLSPMFLLDMPAFEGPIKVSVVHKQLKNAGIYIKICDIDGKIDYLLLTETSTNDEWFCMEKELHLSSGFSIREVGIYAKPFTDSSLLGYIGEICIEPKHEKNYSCDIIPIPASADGTQISWEVDTKKLPEWLGISHYLIMNNMNELLSISHFHGYEETVHTAAVQVYCVFTNGQKIIVSKRIQNEQH